MCAEYVNFHSLSVLWHDFISEYKHTICKLRGLPQTNLELVRFHFARGYLNDVLFRCFLLRTFAPTFYDVRYYIGRCYFEKLNWSKAAHFFRQYLEVGGEFREEAEYCLAVIDGKIDTIRAIPLGVVAHNFDEIADEYNAKFLYKQDGQQVALFQKICDIRADVKPFGNSVLDLGCGTGYMGQLLKEQKVAERITGVDISGRMLRFAKELQINGRPVYDMTVHQDMLTYLGKIGLEYSKYDIIIASNLITYCTAVHELFIKARAILADYGIIALLFKKSTIEGEFHFSDKLEQFSYMPASLIERARACNLTLLDEAEVKYANGDDGYITIFSKDREI